MGFADDFANELDQRLRAMPQALEAAASETGKVSNLGAASGILALQGQLDVALAMLRVLARKLEEMGAT